MIIIGWTSSYDMVNELLNCHTNISSYYKVMMKLESVVLFGDWIKTFT